MSVAAGNVIVTSAVLAGPISVALLVPLFVPSKNSILPPVVAVGDRIGSVNVLFVSISVPAMDTRVASETAVLNSAKVPVTVLVARSILLFVSVSVVALATTVSSLTAVFNCAIVVVSVLFAKSTLLLVNMSVVALPTNVSLLSGTVHELLALGLIAAMIGDVKVLFVKVCASESVVTVLSIAHAIESVPGVVVMSIPVPPVRFKIS